MSAKPGLFEKDGKSYPTIKLDSGDDSKVFLSFGITKAKLILNHIDDNYNYDNLVPELLQNHHQHRSHNQLPRHYWQELH